MLNLMRQMVCYTEAHLQEIKLPHMVIAKTDESKYD